MLKLGAFAVFDVKAEAYLRPFFAETKGLAVRSFADAVNDAQSAMHKHCEDYTLFHVGWFDVVKGELRGIAVESLGNGLNFRKDEYHG